MATSHFILSHVCLIFNPNIISLAIHIHTQYKHRTQTWYSTLGVPTSGWLHMRHLEYKYCIIICQIIKYRMFNLKVDRILIWVIYLLRFTIYYITQLTCIYSKCWTWCPFILMHLLTRFTMFLATFLRVLSFTSSMARVIFIFKILNFSKKLCLQWA